MSTIGIAHERFPNSLSSQCQEPTLLMRGGGRTRRAGRRYALQLDDCRGQASHPSAGSRNECPPQRHRQIATTADRERVERQPRRECAELSR